MKIAEAITLIEEIAPLTLQESYDNSGLLLGERSDNITAILCTLDITPEVIDEAVAYKANLIVCHHPVLFGNLKSLTGKSVSEKVILQAVRNHIAIYAAHTSLDNAFHGVNAILCDKLKLQNCKVLSPREDYLYKLVTFVPMSHSDKVRNAIFDAGAGHIGNYDSCSYNISGQGTFRAGNNTNPFVGEKGKLHFEDEIRIETIVPADKLTILIATLKNAHPYEEVAYDIYPLRNEYSRAGSGMVGDLEEPMKPEKFLNYLKSTFGIPVIRYAGNINKDISRVALCGGAGMFLLNRAIQEKADAFLTGDIKYHQFFDAEEKLLLCDIGHYESEQFTKEFFYNLLNKKISTFAVHLSKVVTNPINYYL